jgi:hypothetical protein
LATELKSINGALYLRSSIKQLEAEIAVIDARLNRAVVA